MTVPESFTAHVKVLQHHIDQGECCDPFKCVVALALMEAFPQASDVTVGSDFAVVFLDGQRYETTSFPADMAELMDRFDDGPRLE